ncbi:hypothetical protein ABS71_14105 [bacterium SCN 62-11]|nr:hypothetical protein [Candidatus Eremiobacteraeota bacterium]ODT63608.1 MAG: hypothetical protein ABS71_14105 [bacterium SCN 62-11]
MWYLWLLILVVVLALPFGLTALPAWLVRDLPRKRHRLKEAFGCACLLYIAAVGYTVQAAYSEDDNLFRLILVCGFFWAIPLSSSAFAVFVFWESDPPEDPEGIGFTKTGF